MEFALSRATRAQQSEQHSATAVKDNSKMSMLAMAAPSPHAPFRREFAWKESRPMPAEYSSVSRPRTEPERIELPSIRQAIPELRMPLAPQERTKSTTTSPTAGVGAMTPPEYVHSPNSNKRRRLSIDNGKEGERASRVPRLCNSPPRASQQLSQQSQQQQHSSGPSPTRPPSSTENWTSRTSPYMPSGGLPAMRSPGPLEVSTERTVIAPEPRPTLPSLPLLNFDRAPAIASQASAGPRYRSHSGDEYVNEPARMPLSQTIERPQQAPGFAFTPAYNPPNRVQSLSVGSIHPFERTPFAPSPGVPYPGAPAHYTDYVRVGDISALGMGYGMPGLGMAMGMGMDCTKQRKRRGNLPKETTDKLRSWFMAHLHHPYPTEDEKQELMRQTGLQMNQISNWFINARRRQLPAMMNDARLAEAKAAAVSGGGVLPSTERTDYEDRVKQGSVPLSEGEAFDDHLDVSRRRNSLKRGSV